ncbi:MAG: chemotaxis protein CheX, partial [Spirochaetota bacterium]|nr:chemotaxis protein CheX [Spirochaetota bacterium]
MDLRYINPFVASAVSVINEVVGLKATKKQIYIAKGKESQGGVSIFFNIKGDVEGQIIFDLPPGISTAIAQEMIGLHLDDVDKNLEQKDLLKSAITELGNMISGTAITKLEEHQYNCDITPPQVYVGPKARLTHPNMSTIVIEMNTNIGDFSINLVNKK